MRRPKLSDLDLLIEMNADPKVMRFFPAPYTAQRSKELYEAIQEEFSDYGYGLYAVEEKSRGRFVGLTGFHWARFDAAFCPCIEIGWRLHPSVWNQGYATEGARACLNYGFTQLGFEAVYSFTSMKNHPSERVMQKIGMGLYQYFQHPDVPENHPLKPHVCYVSHQED